MPANKFLSFRRTSRAASLLFRSAASLVLMTGLAGCGVVSGSPGGMAQLRVVDASPDAGSLDVYTGSTGVAYNLAFGTVTSYVPVFPSASTMPVHRAGTRTAVASPRATLGAGKQYTLLIHNAAAALGTEVLVDQSQPAAAGTVALRFLDEASSAGTLDVYLVPQGSTLARTIALQSGMVAGMHTGYINVPAGVYAVYLLEGGSSVTAATLPMYSGASSTYASGSARTVILLDQAKESWPAVQVVSTMDYDAASAMP